jgi:hypothetical protein
LFCRSAGKDVDIEQLVEAVNIAFPAADCTFDLAMQGILPIFDGKRLISWKAVHSKKTRGPIRPGAAMSPMATMERQGDDSAMHALLEVVRNDMQQRVSSAAEPVIEFSITGERRPTMV